MTGDELALNFQSTLVAKLLGDRYGVPAHDDLWIERVLYLLRELDARVKKPISNPRIVPRGRALALRFGLEGVPLTFRAISEKFGARTGQTASAACWWAFRWLRRHPEYLAQIAADLPPPYPWSPDDVFEWDARGRAAWDRRLQARHRGRLVRWSGGPGRCVCYQWLANTRGVVLRNDHGAVIAFGRCCSALFRIEQAETTL